MGIVVQLADFRQPASDPYGATISADSQRPAEFTLRDRGDLDEWASQGRRVSLSWCEMGTFAMLYESGASWASCGVVRQQGAVLLWDCVTFADIGWFPSMFDALRAMPVARHTVSVPPVLPFGTAHRQHTVVG